METSSIENRQCDVIEPEASSESVGMLDAPPAQTEYMGVVPLPCGSWGAQFYDRERRVWLGAFDVKDEATPAYDVAVQRFRGRGAVTNFEPLEAEELAFLCSRSKEEVVDMLRRQMYRDLRADQGMELVRDVEGVSGRRRGESGDLPPLHRRRTDATLHLSAQAARDAGGCHTLLQAVWR